jgi:hypothetical protein
MVARVLAGRSITIWRGNHSRCPEARARAAWASGWRRGEATEPAAPAPDESRVQGGDPCPCREPLGWPLLGVPREREWPPWPALLVQRPHRLPAGAVAEEEPPDQTPPCPRARSRRNTDWTGPNLGRRVDLSRFCHGLITSRVRLPVPEGLRALMTDGGRSTSRQWMRSRSNSVAVGAPLCPQTRALQSA